MSYDTCLKINTGIKETEVLDIGNYTSNIRKMYDEAFGEYWRDSINNKECSAVINTIEKAYNDMLKNPEKYKKFNPPNGWGDYEGAVLYLLDIVKACIQHPKCILEINC